MNFALTFLQHEIVRALGLFVLFAAGYIFVYKILWRYANRYDHGIGRIISALGLTAAYLIVLGALLWISNHWQ